MSCGSNRATAFIAVPCYGDMKSEFVFSILKAQQFLLEKNIKIRIEILSENCHVDDSRNRLVRDFLETECERLIFIDADLSFNAEDLLTLINHDVDVVGGTYPLKHDNEEFPVLELPGGKTRTDGLMEVRGVPTGFLSIKRHVLEKLYDKVPNFPLKNEYNRMNLPLIFERTFINDVRYGGDYEFCRKWRDMGGSVYLDPTFRFAHYGSGMWEGSYISYLRHRNGFELGNVELIENIHDLTKQWGNSMYSCTPEMLYVCMLLAKEAKVILELGSGLSTLIMAKSNPKAKVYSLEHDPIWASHIMLQAEKCNLKNVNVIYSPIIQYDDYKWYKRPEGISPDLVICDGPTREFGRDGIRELNIPGVTMVFDDYEGMEGLCESIMEDYKVMGESRKFVVGKRSKNEKRISKSII